MAAGDSKLVRNVFVSIGGTDVSAYVKDATLPFSADSLEDTAMGDTTHSHNAGLFNWSVTLQAFNSFVAAELNAILWPLVGTKVAVVIRPDSAAKSTSNPEWTGTALLDGYSPIAGSVGTLAMTPVTLKPAGPLAMATA